ncbi:MAG: hypothetical protein AMXMBFR59_26150 [Rhodanobacteraceae bacterium]
MIEVQQRETDSVSRTLSIRTFGTFEIALDGRHGLLPYLKSAMLLLILVLERDRARARDQLARLLWSDLDDDSARRNLRHAISAVNRTFRAASSGDIIVRCGTSRIGVAQDLKIDLDYVSFVAPDSEQLFAQRDAGQLLLLYRGEFLAELKVCRGSALERWVDQHRRRARHRARELFAYASAATQGAAKNERLEQLCRCYLQVDPGHEDAHRLLMELLVRVQRYDDAIDQYGECVRIVDADIGRPPGGATRALYEIAQVQRQKSRDVAPPLPAPTAANALSSVIVCLRFRPVPATGTELAALEEQDRQRMLACLREHGGLIMYQSLDSALVYFGLPVVTSQAERSALAAVVEVLEREPRHLEVGVGVEQALHCRRVEHVCGELGLSGWFASCGKYPPAKPGALVV